MAQDAPDQESKKEIKEKLAEQTYDPRDAVIKPGYVADQNPDEVLDNPAVTPEMPNETRDKDNRRDLRAD